MFARSGLREPESRCFTGETPVPGHMVGRTFRARPQAPQERDRTSGGGPILGRPRARRAVSWCACRRSRPAVGSSRLRCVREAPAAPQARQVGPCRPRTRRSRVGVPSASTAWDELAPRRAAHHPARAGRLIRLSVRRPRRRGTTDSGGTDSAAKSGESGPLADFRRKVSAADRTVGAHRRSTGNARIRANGTVAQANRHPGDSRRTRSATAFQAISRVFAQRRGRQRVTGGERRP